MRVASASRWLIHSAIAASADSVKAATTLPIQRRLLPVRIPLLSLSIPLT